MRLPEDELAYAAEDNPNRSNDASEHPAEPNRYVVREDEPAKVADRAPANAIPE